MYDDDSFDKLEYVRTSICRDATPKHPSKLVVPKQNPEEKLEKIYDKLSADSSITLITPKDDYTSVGHVLEYKCNTCGHVNSARYNFIGKRNLKGKICKGCKELQRKKDLELLLWYRTREFVKRKGGLIAETFQEGEFATKEDQLLVECRQGHIWKTRHVHIHGNHWCRSCAKMGVTPPPVKLVDLRKPDRVLKYNIVFNMLLNDGMDLKFRKPDGRYYAICYHCGTATLLTERQIESRYYLCPERCQRSHSTSVFRTTIQKGEAVITDTLSDLDLKQMQDIYKDGMECYKRYLELGYKIPKPKKATKQKP